MYRFSGQQVPQQGAVTYTGLDGKVHYRNKGIMRALRLRKRKEAQERAKVSFHERVGRRLREKDQEEKRTLYVAHTELIRLELDRQYAVAHKDRESAEACYALIVKMRAHIRDLEARIPGNI